MNRSGGVVVFEVENRLPPLGYVYRYPASRMDRNSLNDLAAKNANHRLRNNYSLPQQAFTMAKKTVSSPAGKLHQRAQDHNYDDSPSKLRSIIRSKNCDLGTALLVFWRGDPNYCRLFPNRWEMNGDVGADVALFDVLVEIEQRVLAGKYKRFEISFDPFCDIGRTNWAENHYEFAWEDFYCDLPLQMYGKSSARKLKSVRPSSDRPVGLSVIAEAEDNTFDSKTQAAIDVLEKHERDGRGSCVGILNEDDPSAIPELSIYLGGNKVPDQVFAQLKFIRNVVRLDCGQQSTDALLKYLKHTPNLLHLDIKGAFTLRGLSNLRHVGQLQRLSIFNKQEDPNGRWLSSLSNVPSLESLDFLTGKFTKLPLDTISELTKLDELRIYSQFPPETDFSPLLKLKIRDLALGSRMTDDYIPSLLSLSKLKKLKYLNLMSHRFSKTGLKELRKAFGKKLS